MEFREWGIEKTWWITDDSIELENLLSGKVGLLYPGKASCHSMALPSFFFFLFFLCAIFSCLHTTGSVSVRPTLLRVIEWIDRYLIFNAQPTSYVMSGKSWNLENWGIEKTWWITECEAYSFATDGYRIFNVHTHVGACLTHERGGQTRTSLHKELTRRDRGEKGEQICKRLLWVIIPCLFRLYVSCRHTSVWPAKLCVCCARDRPRCWPWHDLVMQGTYRIDWLIDCFKSS